MIVEVVDYADKMHIHHSVVYVDKKDGYIDLIDGNSRIQASYAPNCWKYVSTEKTEG